MTVWRYKSPWATKVLLADPPWKFGDGLGKRGADKQYPCMTVNQIIEFELPSLADDVLLMLWRVSAMQQEALDVITEWGFKLKAEMVWNKTTKNDKRHFGMGYYTRASHEVCLLATRGKFKVDDHSIRSVFGDRIPDVSFEAQVQEHSRKPDEQYTIAEALCSGGPYTEIFARRRREGWRSFGDQLAA